MTSSPGSPERLGIADAFTEGRDEMDWVQAPLRASRAGLPLRMASTCRRSSDFWAEGHIRLPETVDPRTLLEDFRADPVANPLPTPSGRIEICSETIAGFGYDDCPGHPVWLEPDEWLGGGPAARFPLHLISNQPATRLHSQLDNGRVSRRGQGRRARAGLRSTPTTPLLAASRPATSSGSSTTAAPALPAPC